MKHNFQPTSENPKLSPSGINCVMPFRNSEIAKDSGTQPAQHPSNDRPNGLEHERELQDRGGEFEAALARPGTSSYREYVPRTVIHRSGNDGQHYRLEELHLGAQFSERPETGYMSVRSRGPEKNHLEEGLDQLSLHSSPLNVVQGTARQQMTTPTEATRQHTTYLSKGRQPMISVSGMKETSRDTDTLSPGAMPTDTASHSVLDDSAKEFVKIPSGDFVSCMSFILHHADVLRTDTDRLQMTARAAYRAGDDAVADMIVDKIILLHECQKTGLSVEESVRYIDELRLEKSGGSRRRLHRKRFESLRLSLKARAISNAPQRPLAQLDSSTKSSTDLLSPSTIASELLNVAEMSPLRTRLSPSSMSQVPLAGGRMFQNVALVQPLSSEANAEENAPRMIAMRSTFTPATISHSYLDESEEVDDGSIISLSYVDLQPRDTFIGNHNGARYEPRHHDAKNFFSRGRVFRMWWHEPAGKHAKTSSKVEEYKINQGPESTMIYSKLLWLVVIKNKKGYSICCPISTYDGRGLKKSGLDESERSAHAIIYSNGNHPSRLPDEPHTRKRPIKVDSRTEYLHYAARVHFGKSHTVHWDASVMDMGRVVAEHRDLLSSYYLAEH